LGPVAAALPGLPPFKEGAYCICLGHIPHIAPWQIFLLKSFDGIWFCTAQAVDKFVENTFSSCKSTGVGIASNHHADFFINLNNIKISWIQYYLKLIVMIQAISP
jgi:hypothetical protein